MTPAVAADFLHAVIVRLTDNGDSDLRTLLGEMERDLRGGKTLVDVIDRLRLECTLWPFCPDGGVGVLRRVLAVLESA